ncbi:tRNA (adenosine(37)-N6)-dimethylallyltransferase MiaA [Bordetella avium]|uniref:tRNA dimethylallyltransferase n=1 Tax=Bordetella avium (strain 197N) TaxID=360910 RepID=MIAA_BORA1|nr:tRNA (adenosine(37)-N6)-dimethylallyltransferase MiaA [Bordetella avium]Q2KX23.1 RecName: Full=tRNA dimethylallyltransferase; AltName: Full=Dimethylallyl diphosphate:tRNA dimethylallyltransferase; Short=DMAPP:tRNA dimethylallyltransferase; Short=DMATase; AltName: Full=Isopentenyl-diphosphate:tRNA isopentenyltransferase; Short=IPP transferase; Short=IPPT; Short=IPTase [Bordetella avium 197N]RIQ48933.1 tRNA (adenosine(37)-N6)-dimethylallyltransferase MiaA [Bordetella avium]RIQ74832.1 tRNA (aden
MNTPPLICLAGPTAAGKSAATLALAERWPLEIINVDSATIYRGMDIGTAKPSAAEQAQVAQHLLDIRDPSQAYSAADFRTDTLALIEDIQARGRIPLLAGGTMLYYKALREGLDDLPQADPVLRAELEARAANEGWPALHAELARHDPITAARLSPNDSQRIQRALEVCLLSGRAMSALLTGTRRPAPSDLRFVTISLEPSDRAGLHARIAQRFDAMLQAGLEAEVRSLKQRTDLHPGLPSVRCVGYRQMWAYLDGEVSFDEAREQGIAATRQLAKRQLTWLRAQPERVIVDCLAAGTAARVVDIAARYLPG